MNPPLSPERARQIHALFDEVVDLAPEERLTRLGQVEDPSLRREVESLLYAYTRADEVLYRLEHGVAAGAPVETDPCPLTGQNVLHYQVLEELGGGGMGVVYKARDTKLGRLVVLKFLPRHLSSDPEARVRLMAEARATSALDHPNLAVVHEVGEHQGQHEKALRMYEKTPWPPGWVYAALGRQQQALQQISTLKAVWAQGAEDGFVTWNLARIYTSLGEREEAIAWLERAYAERNGLLVYLGVHPHFDALRGEPRFQVLLKKMGLDG